MKGEVKMEAVRRIIDSRTIENIIDLPNEFKNHRLEIIILPISEKTLNKPIDFEIDEEVKAISGIANLKGKDYKEFLAEEKLEDYENIH